MFNFRQRKSAIKLKEKKSDKAYISFASSIENKVLQPIKEKQILTYITHHTQGELIKSKMPWITHLFRSLTNFYQFRTIIVKSHLENLNFLELEAFIPTDSEHNISTDNDKIATK